MRFSSTNRRVQSEGCVAEPLQTVSAILPGSRWSCSLLQIVLQDALSEVTQLYSPLKLRVFVDDITALLKAKTKKKRKWQRRWLRRKASNCQSRKMVRKERARRWLRRVVSWKMSSVTSAEKEWPWLKRGDSGRRLENESGKAGSKRKSKEEEVQGEVLTLKQE